LPSPAARQCTVGSTTCCIRSGRTARRWSPIPAEGNLIRRSWFKFFDRPPEPEVRRVVQSWDVGMATGDTNDYSVCTTWLMMKGDYYLLDVFRDRLSYPDLRRKVSSLAQRFGAQTILIEEAGPGMALLQDLRRDPPQGMVRPIGQKPKGSKHDRMVAQSAKIEAGHVHLPKEAAWLDAFLLELLGFNRSRYDDQVDSVSQFLNWNEHTGEFVMIGCAAKAFCNGVEI
jgi:predicted phage terminase large subunit-like protein